MKLINTIKVGVLALSIPLSLTAEEVSDLDKLRATISAGTVAIVIGGATVGFGAYAASAVVPSLVDGTMVIGAAYMVMGAGTAVFAVGKAFSVVEREDARMMIVKGQELKLDAETYLLEGIVSESLEQYLYEVEDFNKLVEGRVEVDLTELNYESLSKSVLQL